MTNLVEFPGLGLSLSVPYVAFTLFGIPIYWYGVCIGIGMLLALLFAFSQSKRFGVDSNRMVDVIMIGFVLAIVGGRLYYLLFIDNVYNTFYDIINLRAGGIAIYGAIIGAFIGAWLGCRLRKVPLAPMFDLAAMGFLIGQACGRWGNFFNQEAFGSNTNMPWGMISPATTSYLMAEQDKLAAQGMVVDPFLPVHPTFLYESLWCALGFLLLFLYRKKRKFNGEIFLFYVIWYGLGRFVIEGLRTDSLMVEGLGIRASQLLAGISVLAGLGIWVIAKVKTAGRPLRVPPLPPRIETIKVETEQGVVKKVEISWPAEQPEPHIEEKRQMALDKLGQNQSPEKPPEQQPPHVSPEAEQKDEGENHGSENH